MNERSLSLQQRMFEFIKRVVAALFSPDGSNLTKWTERAVFSGLYLFGAVVWSFFLSWGRIGFDLHDWTQEGPRFDFLRRSILEGRFPLHIGSELASTERFLAIPDTVISPQIILLRFVEPGLFILLNSLFLYTLGYLGLMLLRREFKWSAVTFTAVFLLFSLNGHPLVQVAVGHSMWISYFLLPFFVLLVHSLLEGKAGWKWVTFVAVLTLGLYMQGGFHFVNWCLMFLFLVGIINYRHLGMVLKGIGFSILLSLPRILPAAIEFAGEGRDFISGYFSVTDLISAFISLRAPEEALSGMYAAFGWWEADVYTGALGFLFLLVFGVYLILKEPESDPLSRGRLMGPIFVMMVLSLGKVFQIVTLLPIPLVNAERVSSRFIIVPVVMLIILAGSQLDRFLRNRSWGFGPQVVSLGLLGVMGHDLLQHARLWRVENMGLLFPSTPVDIRAEVLVRPDPPYITALLVGLGIALLTLLFLLFMVRRERQSTPESV
ncbi:MAG: hypothetical protein GTO14_24140 [Anaerolineales bacterium]|nr:hypothetical protein [Anaerolineales bacterium]